MALSVKDGYRVAEPEFFHDEWPETDSQEMKDLRAALDEAVASVDKMRQKLWALFPTLQYHS